MGRLICKPVKFTKRTWDLTRNWDFVAEENRGWLTNYLAILPKQKRGGWRQKIADESLRTRRINQNGNWSNKNIDRFDRLDHIINIDYICMIHIDLILIGWTPIGFCDIVLVMGVVMRARCIFTRWQQDHVFFWRMLVNHRNHRIGPSARPCTINPFQPPGFQSNSERVGVVWRCWTISHRSHLRNWLVWPSKSQILHVWPIFINIATKMAQV